MTTRDLARTRAASANRLQVVAGLPTELRRSVPVDAQQLVEREGAGDGVVRLRRDLQPTHRENT